ncbi:hypothetical protein XENORESO_018208 [Xenotaenia resolanae]|uniref:Uncharacterized protein n=1 Tax=Xenotaenia resolanae TaxID=208358 RepID=A0ABV0W425_9TELE
MNHVLYYDEGCSVRTPCSLDLMLFDESEPGPAGNVAAVSQIYFTKTKLDNRCQSSNAADCCHPVSASLPVCSPAHLLFLPPPHHVTVQHVAAVVEDTGKVSFWQILAYHCYFCLAAFQHSRLSILRPSSSGPVLPSLSRYLAVKKLFWASYVCSRSS